MQFICRSWSSIEERFEELTGQMADPAVISDDDQYRKVAKAQSELSEVVAKYREWKKATSELEQARGHARGDAMPNCGRWRRMKSRGWSRSCIRSKRS